MAESPFRGAFPHQHRDPRSLRERIGAQLAERIEDAVEMFALKLMVDRRAREGRPAPETSSPADRREFEQTTAELLAHLRGAFAAQLAPELHGALETAERPAAAGRERGLAAQVWLARQLPDYWQQLEQHAAAFPDGATAPERPGWLHRLLGSGQGPGPAR